MLTLEYALKSPGHAEGHSWSSDGRRVAIAFLQGTMLILRYAIYTLEIGNRTLNGPFADGQPSEDIALSPDGSLLATTFGQEVRAYTLDKFALLAHAEAPVPGCYFGSAPLFSLDSASLWVPCSWRQNLQPGQSGFGAVKYKLPELTLLDRVTVAEPVNDARSSPTVRVVDRHPILVGVIRHSPDAGTPLKAIKYFARCFDLNDKKPCFKAFELAHRPSTPNVLQLSTSFSLIAVSADRQDQFPPASLASNVDFYNTTSGELVATTSVPAHIRSIPVALEFLSGDKYLVAAFKASKTSKGGMAIWDLRTGELLQTIQRGPIEQMSASPDGSKLLALTDEEILMFRIAR